MSKIRNGAGHGNGFNALAPNDDRCQPNDYTSRQDRRGVDVLWDRSGFLGQGGASFWGTGLSSEIWDTAQWDYSPAGEGQRRVAISGVTRDSGGVALAGVTVKIFNPNRNNECTDVVTSDAAGNYSATTPYDGETHFCWMYKSTPVWGGSNILTPA